MKLVWLAALVAGCFFEPPRPVDSDARSGDGGLGPGDGAGPDVARPHIYMFVTSHFFAIDLTSTPAQRVMAARAFCQTAAFAAIASSPVRGGYYLPWFSAENLNAADALAASVARVWRRSDDQLIAQSIADLTDGTLPVPPVLDENGDPVPQGSRVATGTSSAGIAVVGSDALCGMGHIEVGDPSSTTATWTDVGYLACGTLTLRLYCFEYDAVGS